MQDFLTKKTIGYRDLKEVTKKLLLSVLSFRRNQDFFAVLQMDIIALDFIPLNFTEAYNCIGIPH